jgi:hypothetical protein
MTITPPLRTISWFYNSPGNNGFQVVERVRQTLWDARFYDFWFDSYSASAPYKVGGLLHQQAAELEWQPKEWLRLRSKTESGDFMNILSYLIGVKPALRFTDSDGFVNVEWRLKDSEARWKEINGNPIYQGSRRL